MRGLALYMQFNDVQSKARPKLVECEAWRCTCSSLWSFGGTVEQDLNWLDVYTFLSLFCYLQDGQFQQPCIHSLYEVQQHCIYVLHRRRNSPPIFYPWDFINIHTAAQIVTSQCILRLAPPKWNCFLRLCFDVRSLHCSWYVTVINLLSQLCFIHFILLCCVNHMTINSFVMLAGHTL